jgi:glycine/D-amino acid oxidase-like deaminating enzyme
MSAMLAEPAEKLAAANTPRTQQTGAKKRVVIIGGGFAGIAAARALKHADAEVVLIDRRNSPHLSAAPLSSGNRGACSFGDRRANPAARGQAAKRDRGAG